MYAMNERAFNIEISDQLKCFPRAVDGNFKGRDLSALRQSYQAWITSPKLYSAWQFSIHR